MHDVEPVVQELPTLCVAEVVPPLSLDVNTCGPPVTAFLLFTLRSCAAMSALPVLPWSFYLSPPESIVVGRGLSEGMHPLKNSTPHSRRDVAFVVSLLVGFSFDQEVFFFSAIIGHFQCASSRSPGSSVVRCPETEFVPLGCRPWCILLELRKPMR